MIHTLSSEEASAAPRTPIAQRIGMMIVKATASSGQFSLTQRSGVNATELLALEELERGLNGGGESVWYSFEGASKIHADLLIYASDTHGVHATYAFASRYVPTSRA
jgi:hypothetical protein